MYTIHPKTGLSGLTLFLCLLMFSSPLFSQDFKGGPSDKRIFSLNPALVFSGDGDSWGFGSEVSHLKTIGKHFYLKQNLASWIVNGSSWIDGGFENQTGIDLSAEFGVSPFKMKKRFLSLSGGICGAYSAATSPTSGGSMSIYNYETGEYMSLSHYNQGFESGFDIGITFGISYHTQLSPAIYLNTRAAFRTHYIKGSAISMISIGLGFDAKQLFN
jgi:hypothetical protein